MGAPCGKGLYVLAPGGYPGNDPGAYAKALGCDFVVAQSSAIGDGPVRRLQDQGLRVHLFEFPGMWHPTNWERTFSTLATRSYQLGLAGVVADVEDWPLWREEPAGTFERLGAALGSVGGGFTTFPSWGSSGALATLGTAGGGQIWASPQIYGRTGQESADLGAWLLRWKRMPYWKAVIPSVWPDPQGARGELIDRTPAETAQYLSYFRDEPGMLIYQGARAAPGTADFVAIQRATVRSCFGWGKALLALGLLGGAAYGGAQLARRWK